MATWGKSRERDSQPKIEKELIWIANIVEYVNFLNALTRINGNLKSIVRGSRTALKPEVPLFGPMFNPPTWLDI